MLLPECSSHLQIETLRSMANRTPAVEQANHTVRRKNFHSMPMSNRLRPAGKSPLTFDLIVFYAFVLAIAAFGGSSRYDLTQLAILQPLSWLLLGITLVRLRSIQGYRALIGLSVACGIWLFAQIVPLPFWLWSALPGREAIVAADLATIGEVWRPFSLVPWRTANALGSFPMILAPILATINLRESGPKHVLIAILALAVASALLGLLQILSGELYFYRITSTNRMVGLFANTNHNASFGAFAIVVASILLVVGKPKAVRQTSIAVAALLVLLMIVNGSRSGLATLAIAVTTFVGCFWLTSASASRDGKTKSARNLPIALAILALPCLIAIFLMSGRITALDNLANQDPLGDLRFSLTPLLIDMALAYFPFGSGIGTFESAFYIVEPDRLLAPSYVNMAHNDLLQIVIEGGIIGILLVFAVVTLVVRAMGRLAKGLAIPEVRSLRLSVLGMVVILVLASAFDYPLRTPIFQASMAFVITALFSYVHHRDSAARDS